MSEDKSHDPFAEFAPQPSAASSGQAAAAICGGVVFGAAVGAACAYFWSLDYFIAAGVGGAIGALAGWLSAPAKG